MANVYRPAFAFQSLTFSSPPSDGGDRAPLPQNWRSVRPGEGRGIAGGRADRSGPLDRCGTDQPSSVVRRRRSSTPAGALVRGQRAPEGHVVASHRASMTGTC